MLNTEENLMYLRSPEGLRRAKEIGKILEGRAVLCDSEHNLIVDLCGTRGIIPRNEGALGIREGTTRDIAIISRTGIPVCFQVIDLWEDPVGGVRPLLSRGAAQQRCREEYISTLRPGQVISGRVTHLEPFGCFVDIGIKEKGLVHISQLADRFVSDPTTVVSIHQQVRVRVLGIDHERRRIQLTMKKM